MTRAKRARMITRRLVQPPAQDREGGGVMNPEPGLDALGAEELHGLLSGIALGLEYVHDQGDCEGGWEWLAYILRSQLDEVVKRLGRAQRQQLRGQPEGCGKAVAS
jgi:hypothetical protein